MVFEATYLVAVLTPAHASAWCGQYGAQISKVLRPNNRSNGMFIYDYAYGGVRELYAQVLRKVAYWQTAAQVRNYLLSLALEAEQRQ